MQSLKSVETENRSTGGAASNPLLRATQSPPVMAARSWIEGRTFPAERPLLNMSQAAPADPPPQVLRDRMAAAISEDATHLYGPVLGSVELRAEIAARWSRTYSDGAAQATIASDEVAVTSGCNQAFCAAIETVAEPGDAVLVPTPWYFNHAMWLRMAGVEAVPIPCDMGHGAKPSLATAAEAITPRTKAIVLVTPNNPTGAEYSPDLIDGFFELAQDHGLALIIDETYRDFLSRDGAPHRLFARADWRDTLIHLYSFSKVFRLTGHRIGAMIASSDRLAEAEKFLDTVTICPTQLGQVAALEGLRKLGDWVADERQEVLARGARLRDAAQALPEGWRVLSSGAYFAYLHHPFDAGSEDVAKALVDQQSLLCLPGSMFAPPPSEKIDNGIAHWAKQTLRLAFANCDAAGIDEAMRRLAAFRMDA
ncbi:MAG: aminotransferase [Pseudomonadota bacterium]